MDMEDSPLLNISRNKLNPACPAFLHSQEREKDTDMDWFSSSSASSPVSQKNTVCSLSQEPVTTVTAPSPLQRSEVRGNYGFGFYLRKIIQSYKYWKHNFSEKIWNAKSSQIFHIAASESPWSSVSCLTPVAEGSAQGCPAGKSGRTSHVFNPDC